MKNIRKIFAHCPFIFVANDWDTVNMVCRHGHVYCDGDRLVASLDSGTRAECAALRRLGEVVMDGDDGELSVSFEFTPAVWDQVRKILRPKQSACLKTAA